MTDLQELHYSAKDLMTEMESLKIKVTTSTIREYMQDTYKYYPGSKVKRYNYIPFHMVESFNSENPLNVQSQSKSGFPYVLKREDFIKDDEL